MPAQNDDDGGEDCVISDPYRGDRNRGKYGGGLNTFWCGARQGTGGDWNNNLYGVCMLLSGLQPGAGCSFYSFGSYPDRGDYPKDASEIRRRLFAEHVAVNETVRKEMEACRNASRLQGAALEVYEEVMANLTALSKKGVRIKARRGEDLGRVGNLTLPPGYRRTLELTPQENDEVQTAKRERQARRAHMAAASLSYYQMRNLLRVASGETGTHGVPEEWIGGDALLPPWNTSATCHSFEHAKTMTVSALAPLEGTLTAVHNFSCRASQDTPSVVPFGPYRGRALHLLVVSGNDGEDIRFVVGSNFSTVLLDQVVIFRANSAAGDVLAPLVLTGADYLTELPYHQSAGRRLLSQSPGGTSGEDVLPSHKALFVADMDNNGGPDLVVHSPAASEGSCAMRCHQRGRFGFDSFDLPNALGGEGKPFCFCGPAFESMQAPQPPPQPPALPPSPPAPPPASNLLTNEPTVRQTC